LRLHPLFYSFLPACAPRLPEKGSPSLPPSDPCINRHRQYARSRCRCDGGTDQGGASCSKINRGDPQPATVITSGTLGAVTRILGNSPHQRRGSATRRAATRTGCSSGNECIMTAPTSGPRTSVSEISPSVSARRTWSQASHRLVSLSLLPDLLERLFRKACLPAVRPQNLVLLLDFRLPTTRVLT
jgi:hypothetical protein